MNQMSSADPMVKAEGVHKSFGRLEVLKGVSLEVQAGEVVCMIGASGSGKSTFLRCINHLERIDSGRLWVDGRLVGYRQSGDKIYELRDAEVCRERSEIGMVFQRFNLFGHMTALENVVEAPIRAGKVPASAGRVGRQDRQLPGAALRWTAATRRDCPRAGDEAEADAVRRADLRPRSGTRRRGSRRDEGAGSRLPDNHGRRHPRDGVRAG